ncbi:MAG: hypothetical protein R3D71_05290 [Rickettsiales bacterium]
MSHINFAEKVKFGSGESVVTYYGKNLLGESFFCYIRCDMDGYKKMKEDFLGKRHRNPESYGKIIYRDNIPEPDEKAREFLRTWEK